MHKNVKILIALGILLVIGLIAAQLLNDTQSAAMLNAEIIKPKDRPNNPVSSVATSTATSAAASTAVSSDDGDGGTDTGNPPSSPASSECLSDADCLSEDSFEVKYCNVGVCVECTQDSHCGIFGEGTCEDNVCVFLE